MFSRQLIKQGRALTMLLANPHQNYHAVLKPVLLYGKSFVLDFSERNSRLVAINLASTDAFAAYVFGELQSHGAYLGVGGYGENRVIYGRSDLFGTSGEPRTVHLAIDLWAPVGTEVFTPLDAVIHSFHNNDQFGDYGGTIILQHMIHHLTFFTLYGHLSRESLHGLQIGQAVSAGTQIATFGTSEENGHWPPHLHFQVISDMLGMSGDFPGVARFSEQEHYLALCPNPNLILRLKSLP